MDRLTDFITTNFSIDKNVLEYALKCENEVKDKFYEIDNITEYNQLKVLKAMQKNRLSEAHFAATTGYGYNDLGRDTLEQIYADIFHAEL